MMYSTNSRPFSEENDVSRQAVKPIYVEDWVYDGQAQRTGKTTVSFAAVRAKLKTVSNLAEIYNSSLNSNSSPNFKDPFCYDTFLIYYNLPTLSPNQTLLNFLQHLKNNLFNKPFKISINITLTETHVYQNLNNAILPNHILLPKSHYYQYYNLPIKSYQQYSIPNSLTESDFFNTNNSNITNPISSISHSFDPILTDNIPSLQTSLTPIISIPIKIGSLNINGLLQHSKKISLIDIINQHNFDIFGISESHLTPKEGKFINKNLQNYNSFWSSYENPYQAGVGIFIHKRISKYIAKSHNYNGHIIGLDLHFKHNSIRILQIYLPTSEKKQLRAKIQEQIILLCNNSNYQHIILCDFNSIPNPHQDRNPPKNTSIPESQILKYLISHQFKDIYRLFFLSTLNFTFSRSTSHSRIDQIWTNLSISQIEYTDILEDISSESDHKITTLEISITINKTKPSKQHTRKNFLWKSCLKENLENYSNQTSQSLYQLQKQISNISNQNELNTTWNKILKALTKAALKNIPFKKIKTIQEIKSDKPSK